MFSVISFTEYCGCFFYDLRHDLTSTQKADAISVRRE